MHCVIWYYLYDSNNVKSTHRGMLLLVKMHSEAVKNTHGELLLLVKLQAKSNTPPWVFFMFFKLYKCNQTA